MASKGKFEYGEFKTLLKNTIEIRKEFHAWFKQFLLVEALRALRLVRPRTPWKTGTLRRSWSVSNVERTGVSIVVYLVNPIEYASYMEEGRTVHTYQGSYWWEGFHMAELSILEVSSKIPARFQKEFATWLSLKGWGTK